MKKIDNVLQIGLFVFYCGKTFRSLRVFVFLGLIIIFNAYRNVTYSQFSQQVINSQYSSFNLDMHDVPIQKVLNAIENNSDFLFLYSSKVIDVNQLVDIQVKSESIVEVLNDLFANTNIKYTFKDKQILLGNGEKVAVKNIQQEKRITGKVTSTTGDPIPGVSVLVPGTVLGTLTDAEGVYSISVPNNTNLLAFSFIGMERQEVIIQNQSVINVVMKETAIDLEEVVVIGYGTQKKVTLTGAVSAVDNETLNEMSVGDAISRLEGNVTGVTITNNWRPGASTSVRVRGVGSIRSNDPLYVVDGVPRNSFDNIDPNDIESMTVLKDASSAAIYGTRAANGVILITTKRGKEGRARLSFNARHGFQYFDPSSKPNLLSSEEWLANMKQKWINMGLSPGMPGWGDPQLGYDEPRLPDYILPAGKMEGEVDESTYTHPSIAPYNAITRTHKGDDLYDIGWIKGAPIDEYNINMSGGAAGSNYSVSLGYFHQKGLYNFAGDDINKPTNNGFTRYTLRSNSDISVAKWLKISPDLSATYMRQQGTTGSGSGVLNWNPLLPIYDIQGNFAGTKIPLMGNGENPVAVLVRNADNYTNRLNVQSSVAAQATVKKFIFRSLIGVSYRVANSTARDPADPEWNQTNNTAGLSSSADRSFQYNWTNTLNYLKTIGNHNINVLLGTETVDQSSEDVSGSRTTFAFEDLDYMVLSAGEKDITNSGSKDGNRLFSYFARLNYDFKGKYLFEGVVRRDGSSRFVGDYRWGTFPAFSVGWRLSEEQFIKANFTWITNLKIRAGWGKNGNDNVGNYNAYSAFGAEDRRSFYNITGASRSSVTAGFSKLRIGNPEARWETGLAKNIGIDFTLFKSKLEGTIDLFDRRTIDMLYRDSRPAVWGLVSLPDINIGEMKNTGYEFTLSYKEQIGSDLFIRVRVNASHFRNEVVKLNDNPNEIYYSNSTEAGNSTATVAGEPMASFFGYIFEGYFNSVEDVANWPKFNPNAQGVDTYSQPGVMKFKDVTGDGIITSADRTIFGHGYPKLSYGLNFNTGYKNWDFSFALTGVYGRNIINNAQRTLMFIRNDGNYLARRYYESWTPERYAAGEKITAPITINKDANMQLPSSWFMSKGDYLRVRDIQIGYHLPRTVLSKLKISSFRAYIQANNLFTFTKYIGQNPEVSENGVDGSVYPTPRVFSIGINMNL